MKRPPCKADGVECAKRRVGCSTECEAYQEWLAAHKAELATERIAKKLEADIAIFEGERFLRQKKDTRRKIEQKRRRDRG